MKRLLARGPLFIAIAAFLWSLDGLLRTELFSLPPAIVVFWEHALVAIVAIPLLIFKRSELAKLHRKEWLALLLVGIFSGALGTMLYTAALGKINFIQFSVVPLLQQLQPLWAIATAAILLREKISKKFLLWAGVALVGSYLVTFKDFTFNIGSDSATLEAALFALLAGMMWGCSTGLSKVVLKRVSFFIGAALRFALVPIITLFIILGLNQQGSMLALEAAQWKSLLFIVLSTGGLALVLYYYGLKRTPARVSTIVELVWPMSAIFIDYFYFQNTLSVSQIIGAVLLLTAMYKVVSTQSEEESQ